MRRNIVSYARYKNDELKDKNWFGQKTFRIEKLTQEAILELPKFKRVNFSLGWGENEYLDLILREPTADDGYIPIGTVSKQYSLIQHAEVFEAIIAAGQKLGLDFAKQPVEIILSHYGERMKATWQLPGYDFDPGDGKPIVLVVAVTNSVDKSCALEIQLEWLRLVCKNGMMFGLKEKNLYHKHVAGLDPAGIAGFVSYELGRVPKERQIYQTWFKEKVSFDQVFRWADEVVAPDWGALAAARVINIAKTGFDGEFLRPFDKGKPSEKEMKKTVEVPGAFAPIENKFHVSQALSWIAKERNSLQDQVQKLYDIPALISRLKDN